MTRTWWHWCTLQCTAILFLWVSELLPHLLGLRCVNQESRRIKVSHASFRYPLLFSNPSHKLAHCYIFCGKFSQFSFFMEQCSICECRRWSECRMCVGCSQPVCCLITQLSSQHSTSQRNSALTRNFKPGPSQTSSQPVQVLDWGWAYQWALKNYLQQPIESSCM